jgi:phosphate transport system permease protein
MLAIIAMASGAYLAGSARSVAIVGGPRNVPRLHSLPGYHGYYVAIWCLLPAMLIVLVWLVFENAIITALLLSSLPADQQALSGGETDLLLNNIRRFASAGTTTGAVDSLIAAAAERYNDWLTTSRELLAGLSLSVAAGGALVAWFRIAPAFRARNRVEGVVRGFLLFASTLAVLTTLGIVFSVLFEAIRFFREVPVGDFLFGLEWSPQTAIRADQVGSSGNFGAVPLFTGTLLITVIAMFVAVPVGLMTAIYLADYSSRRARAFAKPVLEVLAGIPTVVYGFFAAMTVAPAIRAAGVSLGLDVASESALAAGLVMGIMIIPLVSSLSDDAINAVPVSIREAAIALGSTRSENIRHVVLPAALPGIVGGVLLAVSRAIGETMIVVMAAGLAANLTANPFEAVTTVTVQIVTLLVGDQEFDSAKTLAAFALGLVLFLVTLQLNVTGLRFMRRYREHYE